MSISNKLNGLTINQAVLLRDALDIVDPETSESIEDKAYLLSQLNDILHFLGHCDACEGRGYLEVMHDNGRVYIEACETCDYFGIIERKGEPSLNERARAKARSEGVRINKDGSVRLTARK